MEMEMMKKIKEVSPELDNLGAEAKAAIEGFVTGMEMGLKIKQEKEQEGGAA